MKKISKLSTNKYLLPHNSECDMTNIFRVSHILQFKQQNKQNNNNSNSKQQTREMFEIFHEAAVR